MTPMARRLKAAQGCIDRFAGKPYNIGKKRDCLRLLKHNLHLLGRRMGQGKIPDYSSEAGGLRALRKAGFDDLVAAVDSLGLDRIAPLAALPGDIIALPTDGEGFGCALAVAVGNGRVIGFKDGVGQVLQPLAYVAAWRAV